MALVLDTSKPVRLSRHAKKRAAQREIARETIVSAIEDPDAVLPEETVIRIEKSLRDQELLVVYVVPKQDANIVITMWVE